MWSKRINISYTCHVAAYCCISSVKALNGLNMRPTQAKKMFLFVFLWHKSECSVLILIYTYGISHSSSFSTKEVCANMQWLINMLTTKVRALNPASNKEEEMLTHKEKSFKAQWHDEGYGIGNIEEAWKGYLCLFAVLWFLKRYHHQTFILSVSNI